MASFGIDIGTTSCKLCCLDGQELHIFTVADGGNTRYGDSRLMVSAAFLDSENDEELVIGQEAYNRRLLDPSCYVSEFKRDFSRTVPILFSENTQLTVDDIYVEIIRCFRSIIEQYGRPVDNITLTHPASYTGNLIARLVEDAHKAGYYDIETIDEPSAAAQFYAYSTHDVAAGENILVYDFGGGTFDAALVRLKKDGSFRHLCRSMGLGDCGGSDIDRLILRDMLAGVSPEGKGALQNANNMALFNEMAMDIKHRLTEEESVSKIITAGSEDFIYTLTREKFEAMILPLVRRTTDLCLRMMEEAGIAPENVQRIVLTGGTSYIPLVERELHKYFPAAGIGKAGYALHMVCQGAAVKGSLSVSPFERLLRRAEYGDADAQGLAGLVYLGGEYEGDEIPMDKDRAYMWLTRAAGQGNAAAMYFIGLCYEKEIFVSEDKEQVFKWYRRAAELGNPDAQWKLGLYYVQIYKDEDRAFEWFLKSARQGNAIAQYYVGLCYEAGISVPKDREQAFDWYLRAASQGDPDAQYKVGVYYNSIYEDKNTAFEWFLKSARQGHPASQVLVGEWYAGENGVFEDKEQAFEWYLKAAEQGNAMAQNKVGVYYEELFHMPAAAFKWYLESAKQGNAVGQFYLARCYENGKGTERDLEKAFAWYLKAAEQGDTDAQVCTGMAYESGQGVQQSAETALEWYLKAAGQEHAIGQIKAAICYRDGTGTPKNLRKSFKWFFKAAEQGNDTAQLCVGTYYDEGQGVSQDKKEAYKWYLKAAMQDNVTGMYNVGVCLHNGEGVNKDRTKAEEWFRKAAKGGSRDALDILQKHYADKANPIIMVKRESKFAGGSRNFAIRIDNKDEQVIKNGSSFMITLKPGKHHIEIYNMNFTNTRTDWSNPSMQIYQQTLDFDRGDILVCDMTAGNTNIYWKQ